MANYSYTNSGINFTINDDNGLTDLGGLYGNQSSEQWQKINEGKKNIVRPFVNAVEIDWNSAIIGEG